MQITLMTIMWSVFALVSVLSLYFFNRGLGLINFVTSRKYLLLTIIASLFGMREVYWVASILLAVTCLLMYLDYQPYVEKCKAVETLKNMQNHK